MPAGICAWMLANDDTWNRLRSETDISRTCKTPSAPSRCPATKVHAFSLATPRRGQRGAARSFLLAGMAAVLHRSLTRRRSATQDISTLLFDQMNDKRRTASATRGGARVSRVVAVGNACTAQDRRPVHVQPSRDEPAAPDLDASPDTNEPRRRAAGRPRLVAVEATQNLQRRAQAVDIAGHPLAPAPLGNQAGIRSEIVEPSRRAAASREHRNGLQPARHRHVREWPQSAVDEEQRIALARR